MYGGIAKDQYGNETPFTGKGRSIPLPGGGTQLIPATVWAQRPENGDVRFYEKLENKLEAGIGVTYGGTTASTGTKLEDWRKVLLKSVKQFGLDALFTVAVDGKEVNIIDDYAPFTYELCTTIHENRINKDEYDYYEMINLEYAYRLIVNSLSPEVI